jgi:16S rRNA (cytidine1402-2'-O)-methyltransferase
LAIRNNIPLTFIPGPNALIGALVLSGKPTHKFVFLGFLPKSSASRKNQLRQIQKHKYTAIFYESRHRILKTLEDIKEVFGEKEICCVRELTKKFEEIKRASAAKILEDFKRNSPKGEFVIVI